MVAYIKGAFGLVPQNILHGDIVSGQVIQAGPAKIQVLNQAYKMNNDFINNSSVAYMVSLNGTNTVFLGDLAKSGGEQLMADHDPVSYTHLVLLGEPLRFDKDNIAQWKDKF